VGKNSDREQLGKGYPAFRPQPFKQERWLRPRSRLLTILRKKGRKETIEVAQDRKIEEKKIKRASLRERRF